MPEAAHRSYVPNPWFCAPASSLVVGILVLLHQLTLLRCVCFGLEGEVIRCRAETMRGIKMPGFRNGTVFQFTVPSLDGRVSKRSRLHSHGRFSKLVGESDP